jgi:hypothetical protein
MDVRRGMAVRRAMEELVSCIESTVFDVCKGGRALEALGPWSYLSQPGLLIGERKVAGSPHRRAARILCAWKNAGT